MPFRGTMEMGRFDHRFRCSSSSYANTTFCFWFWSSVVMKAFAAFTISAVGVWAIAAEIESHTGAVTAKTRFFLNTFTLLKVDGTLHVQPIRFRRS
jgi:uncharacterized membrane protein YpjA